MMKNMSGKNIKSNPDPRVAIIIVNWNGKDNTIECLESIRRVDYPEIEVIVVDNGSSDGSVSKIKHRFPDVAVLEAKKNLGTSGGRNIGLRHFLEGDSDYALFLDNDTILDSQLIRKFLEAADAIGGHGILGAKIYYFDQPGLIWYAGSEWIDSRFEHLGMGYPDDGRKFESISETAYVCGCALFADRTVIEKTGFFDEKYFAYFEETDFCYRARRSGFKSFVVPSAKVWHKISSSTGGSASLYFYYYMNRNVLLWAERYLPASEKLILYREIAGNLFKANLPPRFSSVKSKYNGTKDIVGMLNDYVEIFKEKYKDPQRKATLMGVRDYLIRRFGCCPDAIGKMQKSR